MVFKSSNIKDCKLLDLPKVYNRAGNITPIHPNIDIPFDIKRVFYIYDIPGGEERGAHAHIKCHQFIVAASGSFEVELDDGKDKKTIILNRSYVGLYIPPGIWAAEKGFSSGAVCLVFASHIYEEYDYLRKYEDFQKFKLNNNESF